MCGKLAENINRLFPLVLFGPNQTGQKTYMHYEDRTQAVGASQYGKCPERNDIGCVNPVALHGNLENNLRYRVQRYECSCNYQYVDRLFSRVLFAEYADKINPPQNRLINQPVSVQSASSKISGSRNACNSRQRKQCRRDLPPFRKMAGIKVKCDQR